MTENVQQSASPYMRRCLDLAEEARRHGDAPVGSVIVHNNVVVAEAWEQVQTKQDMTAHAELLAIQQACRVLGTKNLTGCELFTNMEPCWMCSFAIRETGIVQVVIGRSVEDIGGVTSQYPILTEANIPGWGPPPEVVWWRTG